MFIREAWYAALWCKNVAPGTLVSRTLLGEPVVFFRDDSGVAHAVEDRCPHRHVPLSLGTLKHGTIQCAYHGLRFAADGRCIANPFGQNIPRNAQLRAYPVREAQGVVWIWMGAGAPTTQVPHHFDTLDPEAYFVASDELTLQANYLLAIDNILDLSHLEFLHPSTLGSAELRNASVETSVEDGRVFVKRVTYREQLSKMLSIAFQVPLGIRVDRRLEVEWRAPASALVVMTVQPSDTHPAMAQRRIDTYHFFTPRTQASCYYMFAATVSKKAPGYSQAAVELGLRALRQPFELEDLKMLEAQQRIQELALTDYKPVVLPGDAGSQRAREILRRLYASESRAANCQTAGTSPFQRP